MKKILQLPTNSVHGWAAVHCKTRQQPIWRCTQQAFELQYLQVSYFKAQRLNRDIVLVIKHIAMPCEYDANTLFAIPGTLDDVNERQ